MAQNHHDHCRQLIDEGTPFVVVTLVESDGSVPADVGAKMIVTPTGLTHGTVGGGRVEAAALRRAGELLRSAASTDCVHWNLNTDLGMTCGGRVRFFFDRIDAAAWSIVIFGAGHVAQALSRLLTTLPCRVTCIDSRREWLDRLPSDVHVVQAESLPDAVESLPADAYVVCMTQGHATDRPILQRIWQSGRSFPFIGVIGSKSKAGAIRRELRESGLTDDSFSFHCPVGLPIGTNHPGEIAVSIAAQLLQFRDAKQPVRRRRVD